MKVILYLLTLFMNTLTLALLTILAASIIVSLNHNAEHSSFNLNSQQIEDVHHQFSEWIQHNKVKYTSPEERSYRFTKFLHNSNFVKQHNMRFQEGSQTFDVEMNKFADLDNKEFRAMYTGLQPNWKVTKECTGSVKILDNPPAEVDWTAKNAVNAVKNQGMCGSCWAFSAVGALEAECFLTTAKLHHLSVQQLVDCAGGPYENEGCNGGLMANAFWYVIDHGITSQFRYPYHAKDEKCGYKPNWQVFRIKSCADVPANQTLALQSAVAARPVSVSVEADSLKFQLYKSGVLSGECGTDLDHGILLTGYGNLNGKDFWKCKNSWGESWGMAGYILLARGEDGPGQCGIMMENNVPIA